MFPARIHRRCRPRSEGVPEPWQRLPIFVRSERLRRRARPNSKRAPRGSRLRVPMQGLAAARRSLHRHDTHRAALGRFFRCGRSIEDRLVLPAEPIPAAIRVHLPGLLPYGWLIQGGWRIVPARERTDAAPRPPGLQGLPERARIDPDMDCVSKSRGPVRLRSPGRGSARFPNRDARHR